MNRRRSVCIVGAGPSGLTALKTLVAAGIDDVVCYEAEAEIGGNWVYKDQPGHASVYETTHLITSKQLSQFSDFPMPADFPAFPSHRQILEYLRAYAQRFDLGPRIRLRTRVVDARRAGNGWSVDIEGPEGRETRSFDNLIVCSGHHWKSFTPQIATHFTGQSLHSHDYRKAESFRGKRVLVVGGGNSGADIAVAVAAVAAQTSISIRSGQYIIPKFVYGRPADRLYSKLQRLPRFVRQAVLRLGVRLAMGSYARYGLAEPEAGLLAVHPTLNTELLDRLVHGSITPHRGIEAIDGRQVSFVDGSAGNFDAIIWATGFSTAFPFFAPDVPNPVGEDEARLYLRMIPEGVDNLFYVGFVQPTGCIWTLSELQSRVVAAIIAGQVTLPAERKALIDAEIALNRRSYKPGRRNALAIDFYDYSRQLRRLLEVRSARAA